MVIQEDQAKIIVASWLIGYRTEDAKLIPPNFLGEYTNIGTQIRSGILDPFEIAKRIKMGIKEMAELTNYASKGLYDMAMLNIKHQKMIEEVEKATENRASAEEIRKIAAKYSDNIVKEVPKQAQGMSETFMEEVKARENREIINTEIGNLDALLCGIKQKELTSVGARPSVGKSAFMLQTAINVVKQGKKVLYFPLEMSTEQTTERILCRYLSKTSPDDLRKGRLTNEQKAEVELQLQKINELESSGNWLVFEGVGHLEVIEALIKKHQPYMVVVDQLQQMKSVSEKFNDVRSRFSFMTSELKRIAMEHDVAVWLACQVNRTANQNSNNEPTLENLKESGSIEEDSDNVILLHRDEKAEEEQGFQSKRIIQANIAKQRSGPTNKVKLMFVPERFAFYPLDNSPSGFESYKTNDIPF